MTDLRKSFKRAAKGVNFDTTEDEYTHQSYGSSTVIPTVHTKCSDIKKLSAYSNLGVGYTHRGNTFGLPVADKNVKGFDLRFSVDVNIENIGSVRFVVEDFHDLVKKKPDAYERNPSDTTTTPTYLFKEERDGWRFCGKAYLDVNGIPVIILGTQYYANKDPHFLKDVKAGKMNRSKKGWQWKSVEDRFGFHIETEEQLNQFLDNIQIKHLRLGYDEYKLVEQALQYFHNAAIDDFDQDRSNDRSLIKSTNKVINDYSNDDDITSGDHAEFFRLAREGLQKSAEDITKMFNNRVGTIIDLQWIKVYQLALKEHIAEDNDEGLSIIEDDDIPIGDRFKKLREARMVSDEVPDAGTDAQDIVNACDNFHAVMASQPLRGNSKSYAQKSVTQSSSRSGTSDTQKRVRLQLRD